ncbi:MAG: 50S ribosomal protein L24 [Lentisphaerae bacterium]|nr:50S ribosomal protein L24 [Lentisphaerota bacterium]
MKRKTHGNTRPAAVAFKKGETVIVLSGEDKGKTGKVLQVLPGSGRALVEGVNLVKKHMRKSQDNPKGGILEKEAPLPVCKLRAFDAARKAAGKPA